MIFALLLLFVLGTAVGSFLNVLIYRTINNESWVYGRSHCDFCSKKIHWYDNIPILSFLFLRGKTRCCQKAIPLSYPIVEFITGSLFVWWYGIGFVFFKLTESPLLVLQPLFWLIVGVILLTIFFSDLLHMIIPDFAVLLLLGMTVFYRVYLVTAGVMQLQDLWLAFLGMFISVVFLGSLWFFTQGRGMGLGDVKLVAPLSLLLGWPSILVGLFLSFMSGGFLGLMLIILRKRKMKQVIPFGPFLILGAVLALLWGDLVYSWYMSLL